MRSKIESKKKKKKKYNRNKIIKFNIFYLK
jgi:hypothetical protein